MESIVCFPRSSILACTVLGLDLLNDSSLLGGRDSLMD